MAFHPSSPVLVSGSRDFTIKFFDISKPSIKKAYRSIQVMHQWRQLPLFLFPPLFHEVPATVIHCSFDNLYWQNKLLTTVLNCKRDTSTIILYLYVLRKLKQSEVYRFIPRVIFFLLAPSTRLVSAAFWGFTVDVWYWIARSVLNWFPYRNSKADSLFLYYTTNKHRTPTVWYLARKDCKHSSHMRSRDRFTEERGECTPLLALAKRNARVFPIKKRNE